MNAHDFDVSLCACEASLEQLRIRYEQYFQGLDRMAPEREHEAVRRQIRELQRHMPRNTALRFRYQQLKQKRVTLATYWARVCRQIEEGTYQRDVKRARMRKAKATKRKASASFEIDVDLDMDMDMDAEVNAALDALSGDATPPTATATPPTATARSAPVVFKPAGAASTVTFGKPAGARPPSISPPAQRSPAVAARIAPPPPPPIPSAARRAAPTPSTAGIADDSIRRIYDRYLEARRRNNERVDNVKLATLKKSIDKMMPKLKAKHRGKRIDFEVVVKNGRVGLKPVAK